MAGRPHAREFLVDPEMVMTNNAIIAVRLTLVCLIRGIRNSNFAMACSTLFHRQFKVLLDHVKKTDHARAYCALRAYIIVYNYNQLKEQNVYTQRCTQLDFNLNLCVCVCV